MNNLLFLIIFFFLISNNYCQNNNKNEEQLLFVYEHCRHGNRSPNDKKNGLYNNITKTDAYNVYWEKPGLLTESGKLQHFFLGLRNKYKYKNFIDFSKYDKNEIIVRSTGVKRCTESLYYQLLGMYYKEKSKNNNTFVEFDEEKYNFSMPPNIENWKNKKNFYKLNKKIKSFIEKKRINGLNLSSYDSMAKKKFKIKTIKSDFVFVNQRCKNHNRYIREQRKKYKEVIKNNFIDIYAEKLKKIFNYTDNYDSFFYKWSISKSLADHFISDYSNGRKKELNIFSKKTGIEIDNFFQNCKNIYFFYMYNVYCYSKSCILNASRFMKEIINYFDDAINYSKNKNKINHTKMIIDLGHDVTINSFHILMEKAFNANYTYCVFGCNIYFELYKKQKNNKYIIKYYNNDLLRLNMDYYKFKKKIEKFLWDDDEIDDFCNGEKENIFKIHKEQDLINNENKDKKRRVYKNTSKEEMTDL